MKIGVVGCGNMASAVVKGMSYSGESLEFVTYNPTFSKAEALAKAVSGVAVKELSDLSNVDALLIGCKPQQFDEVSAQLKNAFSLDSKHIISMMAAVSLESIQSKLGSSKISRLMPSLPMEFKEGISLLIHSSEVSKVEREFLFRTLSSSSKTYEMDTEEMFNKVTVISASGPAYVYYMTHGMEKVLNGFGLNSKDSKDMAIQLFKGSSLSMESTKSLELKEMVDKVTSKKGVTIEAIDTFEQMNMFDIISTAADNAYARSCELEELI